MTVFKPLKFAVNDRVKDVDDDEGVVIQAGHDEGGDPSYTIKYDAGITLEQWEHGYDEDELTPLTTTQGEEAIHDANEAKLTVATDHGLRAKFTYTNEQGDTHPVRLEPDDYWHSNGTFYVAGETDEGDYKQYRLDRIQDAVVIR